MWMCLDQNFAAAILMGAKTLFTKNKTLKSSFARIPRFDKICCFYPLSHEDATPLQMQLIKNSL